MAVGQRLRLRLFLEGIEVPLISASTQTSPNAPTSCSLQIPPLAEGTRLMPRTKVDVFFFDAYEAQSPLLQPSAAAGEALMSKGDGGPTMYEVSTADHGGEVSFSDDHIKVSVPDLMNTRYKLLFTGEVVGFAWSKSSTNRSLVLQCLDLSNYWDYAYQFNNTDLFGAGVKALFSGGSTNLFTEILDDESMAILRIIRTPSTQYPNLKGLLGGIVHLLEAIGGSYYYGKQFSGENIFFSLAELRLHLTQTITAYEKDPTASRLIGADDWGSLFGRTLGGLGSQVSIRQAINALMAMIFHETYSIPSPLYIPGTDGAVTGTTRTSLRNVPAQSFIPVTADALIESIGALKSEMASTSNEGFTPGPVIHNMVMNRLGDMILVTKNVLNRIRGRDVEAARGFYGAALTALKKAKDKSKAWQPGATKKVADAVIAALDEAALRLQRAANLEILSHTKGAVPARLNQQIFRPDVWFSAPPRCNVLFPEQYTQLNYARSFLQEPTRLLLKTNDEFAGEDMFFDKFYFAPKGMTSKGQKAKLEALLKNDILDHEMFTGILPVFEKMGELNILAARTGKMHGKMPKIGLAERTTNFLYFKYRFAARQMQVSGRFNPFLAPGFPGLIIDKYVDLETAARRQALIDELGGTNTSIDKLQGTHFLGNFTEVSHTVDQQQGRTDINCSYPRQPEETAEFWGVIESDQTVRKRANADAVRSTVVAAVSPPKRYSLGPNNGNIVAVRDVTPAYQAKGGDDGSHKLPLFRGTRKVGTDQPRVLVPVGLVGPASAYGPDVVTLVGSATEPVAFRAYEIKEEVPLYRREVVDLPAEEYIRPGWYGDCWHPALIGEVYQKFFATGAITDAQEVVDMGGGSFGVANTEKAGVILADAAKAAKAKDMEAWTAALLSLGQNSSVAQAAGFLVQTYSYVRQGGVDVEEFIRFYTWRPVATMVDMFGSNDLTLSKDGEAVVTGVEGFHSRAFGPYENLFGLVTGNIEKIIGLGRNSHAAKLGDTRLRKRNAVLDYISALQFARAVLG